MYVCISSHIFKCKLMVTNNPIAFSVTFNGHFQSYCKNVILKGSISNFSPQSQAFDAFVDISSSQLQFKRH